jgi:hypothetical protein
MAAPAMLDQRVSCGLERPREEENAGAPLGSGAIDKILLASLRRLQGGGRPALR